MDNSKRNIKRYTVDSFCDFIVKDFLGSRNGHSSETSILIYNGSPVVLDRFRRGVLESFCNQGRNGINVNFIGDISNAMVGEFLDRGFYLVDLGWYIENQLISDVLY